MTRILLLDHTAEEGGAELALVRLAEALGDDGPDLRALLFTDGPLRARLTRAGVRTAVLPLDARVATTSRTGVLRTAPRTALATLGFVPRLVRAIRGSGSDLVVANSLKSAVLAAVAAPLAGRLWVWHLHDRLADDYLPRPLVALMRAIAVVGPRRIVVNSEATRRTLPSLARARAVVAHPGLPAAAFRTAHPDSPVTVGIIGRISPTKGQREFLEAAAEVGDDVGPIRFAVIGSALFGEDDYEAGLRALTARLGIAERVEFTGWVTDAGDRLGRLALVVHASPVPEPFGQVVIEAMAAGVPVVATAAGGVPEILDPGRVPKRSGWWTTPTGILVEPGDVPALAAAIREALRDPGVSARRATAARADAELRFTIARTASIVRSTWESALRRPRDRV